MKFLPGGPICDRLGRSFKEKDVLGKALAEAYRPLNQR
jgi:hypothetical protein